MIARNRIWEELKQAKVNILCLQKYTDKRRACNRYYNAFIAIVSSLGALGFSIDESIPFYTSLLVGFVSIIKSILPNFLQSETELSELDNLSDFYVQYMNSLERLWYNFDHNYVDEENTMKCFFDLKETECSKQSKLNKGVRNISKKFQEKLNDGATEYINRVYFVKE